MFNKVIFQDVESSAVKELTHDMLLLATVVFRSNPKVRYTYYPVDFKTVQEIAYSDSPGSEVHERILSNPSVSMLLKTKV